MNPFTVLVAAGPRRHALGLLALFFHRDLGTTVTLWLFGGLALMVVLVIAGLAVLNVLLVWLCERWERRASAWRRGRE